MTDIPTTKPNFDPELAPVTYVPPKSNTCLFRGDSESMGLGDTYETIDPELTPDRIKKISFIGTSVGGF